MLLYGWIYCYITYVAHGSACLHHFFPSRDTVYKTSTDKNENDLPIAKQDDDYSCHLCLLEQQQREKPRGDFATNGEGRVSRDQVRDVFKLLNFRFQTFASIHNMLIQAAINERNMNYAKVFSS